MKSKKISIYYKNNKNKKSNKKLKSSLFTQTYIGNKMSNSKSLTTTIDTSSTITIVRAPKRTKSTPPTVDRDIALKCNTLTTTSAQIRFLQKCGYKPSQIATILGIRPQHAYNVMNQVLKSSK